MFVGEEVNAFQELVARDHPVPASGMDQSRVVADPKPQRAALGRWDATANALDQLIFKNSQWRVRYPRIVCVGSPMTRPMNRIVIDSSESHRSDFWKVRAYSRERTQVQLDKFTTLAQVNGECAIG